MQASELRDQVENVSFGSEGDIKLEIISAGKIYRRGIYFDALAVDGDFPWRNLQLEMQIEITSRNYH